MYENAIFLWWLYVRASNVNISRIPAIYIYWTRVYLLRHLKDVNAYQWVNDKRVKKEREKINFQCTALRDIFTIRSVCCYFCNPFLLCCEDILLESSVDITFIALFFCLTCKLCLSESGCRDEMSMNNSWSHTSNYRLFMGENLIYDYPLFNLNVFALRLTNVTFMVLRKTRGFFFAEFFIYFRTSIQRK